MKWWYGVGIVALLGAGFWIYKAVTVVPPGTRMEEQGREHVSPQEVAAFKYNSNPPTSGPHLPTWVKAGIYDTPQSEGELIHSLEHGYVIVSYNCNVHLSAVSRQLSVVRQVFAHEEEGSPSADLKDPTVATGSAVNESDACKALIQQLKELAQRKKLWKLIVVPRPQLDTTIALTAWTYIDKFDPPAGGFNTARIERFIDFHRDHGPEKTME
ncbi:DUF3105 domain-containing protein [Candidatus Gottesmanbacteria bacterium]|nr:DUF3105 domain-containing protein [Candidatus Gottesmanbacteria bacterium]